MLLCTQSTHPSMVPNFHSRAFSFRQISNFHLSFIKEGSKTSTAFLKSMADLHQPDTWAKSLSRSSIITPIFLRNYRITSFSEWFQFTGLQRWSAQISANTEKMAHAHGHQATWVTRCGIRVIYCDSEKRLTGPWFQENEWLHFGARIIVKIGIKLVSRTLR